MMNESKLWFTNLIAPALTLYFTKLKLKSKKNAFAISLWKKLSFDKKYLEWSYRTTDEMISV